VTSRHYDQRHLLLRSYIYRNSLDLNYSRTLTNFQSKHNKTAFAYKMATYGTVPFSLFILCRMQTIYCCCFVLCCSINLCQSEQDCHSLACCFCSWHLDLHPMNLTCMSGIRTCVPKMNFLGQVMDLMYTYMQTYKPKPDKYIAGRSLRGSPLRRRRW